MPSAFEVEGIGVRPHCPPDNIFEIIVGAFLLFLQLPNKSPQMSRNRNVLGG